MSVEELDKIIEEAKVNLKRLTDFHAKLLGKDGDNIEYLSEERMKQFKELLQSTNAGENQIISRNRKVTSSIERHLVCWIAKYELNIHESNIGYLLGGRDRSTILHSINATEIMIKYPKTAPHYCEKLLNRILKFKNIQP